MAPDPAPPPTAAPIAAPTGPPPTAPMMPPAIAPAAPPTASPVQVACGGSGVSSPSSTVLDTVYPAGATGGRSVASNAAPMLLAGVAGAALELCGAATGTSGAGAPAR